MNEQQVIIGIGTGRCGTTSLAALLNSQPSSAITHEMEPVTKWHDDWVSVQAKLHCMTASGVAFVGDVGFFYLPYVARLITAHEAKVICMQRDKAATVSSYMKKTSGRNHWMDHRGTFWRADPIWDPCYPKFRTVTKRRAISKYYDEYYRRVGQLEEQFPNHVRVFDTEALNDETRVRSLLQFCGFEDPVVVAGVRENELQRDNHSPRSLVPWRAAA